MRDVSRFVFILLLLLCATLGAYFVKGYLDRSRQQSAITSQDAATASAKETVQKSSKSASKKQKAPAARQGLVASDSGRETAPGNGNPLPSTAPADSAPSKRVFGLPTEVPVGTTRAELNSQFGPPDVTLLWSERGVLTLKYVYVRPTRMTTFLLQGEKVILCSTDPVAVPSHTSSALSSPVR